MLSGCFHHLLALQGTFLRKNRYLNISLLGYFRPHRCLVTRPAIAFSRKVDYKLGPHFPLKLHRIFPITWGERGRNLHLVYCGAGPLRWASPQGPIPLCCCNLQVKLMYLLVGEGTFPINSSSTRSPTLPDHRQVRQPGQGSPQRLDCSICVYLE
jgi:hypothetical protein